MAYFRFFECIKNIFHCFLADKVPSTGDDNTVLFFILTAVIPKFPWTTTIKSIGVHSSSVCSIYCNTK